MSKKISCNVTFLALAATLLAACGMPVGPTTLPSPTATLCVPGSVGPFPTTLQPTDILAQFDWEGGFTRWEMSVSLGRVPVFTLLADGSAFYVAGGEHPHLVPAQTMVAHLTPSEAQELVQHVLDLGFECLESYTDQRWQLADGTIEMVADAGISILRVRLPNGELREIRNYADFASDREALQAIRAFLDEYQHPQAEPYTPEKATLFIQPVSEPSDVAVLDWPLDPDWLVLPQTATAPWAAVLAGSDLETLLAATGLNMGDFWFRDADRVFAVYLVPQIPGVDYTDLVTGFGQLLTLKESSGAIEMPALVPSCLQASSSSRPSRLIVEEHRLKTRPIPAGAIPAACPGFLAYFETADGDTGQILGRNQGARDTRALMLASNNALHLPVYVGDEIAVHPGDKTATWTVVGLMFSLNNQQRDSAMPFETLMRELGQVNRTRELAVLGAAHDAKAQERFKAFSPFASAARAIRRHSSARRRRARSSMCQGFPASNGKMPVSADRFAATTS